MNLAQIIGELMRAADVSHLSELRAPAKPVDRAPTLRVPTASRQQFGRGRYRATCLAAQRGKKLSTQELYAEVGGNLSSLHTLLSAWSRDGLVQREGTRHHYRYTVPATEDATA